MKKFSDILFSITIMVNWKEVLIRTTFFGFSMVQLLWSISGSLQNSPSTGHIIARRSSKNLFFFFNDMFFLKEWVNPFKLSMSFEKKKKNSWKKKTLYNTHFDNIFFVFHFFTLKLQEWQVQ